MYTFPCFVPYWYIHSNPEVLMRPISTDQVTNIPIYQERVLGPIDGSVNAIYNFKNNA